jgi:hypothetical protein
MFSGYIIPTKLTSSKKNYILIRDRYRNVKLGNYTSYLHLVVYPYIDLYLLLSR